ncbi:MAG: hypothetical protein ACRDHB_00755 [Actinomycetota bacterium]
MRHKRWRSLIAGILVGSAVLAPTVSGAAAFLTKKKADKRYLGNTTVVKSTATVGIFSGISLTATCPAGQQAIGGGAESPAFRSSTSGGMDITENKPLLSGARSVGWVIEAVNVGSPGPTEISAVAICVP